ncbi:unnamed protein product [Medioppia subpectinata]|uniref:D-beta-hydroxybutyrate dehydrogenase, mitochondrial n=1 Tax=Medioppia subpectinata TaxID=1979941 RepID=A0A7R9KQ06_9ACAR|nr:unnamed protein product [Medioppia subpectinata]CAG2107384.1 unnamed protein product [Medioppia subpectinata]
MNTIGDINGQSSSCDTGFGHRLALRLNERGFRVYATVISESSAGAQQLTSKAQFAHKMHVIGMDVTKHDQVQKAYDYVTLHLNEKSYGDCLWALVNNAGVTSEGPIEWGSPEQYELVFAVNMFGPIRVTRTFLPLIRASKGRVVNMVSIMGRFSVSPFVWYCMTKHALTAFSDTLRQEMRSFGVRVVTVEPAGFSTGLADESNRFTAVCRLWRQTAPEIQNAYGYNSESDLKKLLAKSTDKFKPSPNLDIVVNDLCDAVHNAEPRVRYTPVDVIKLWHNYKPKIMLTSKGKAVLITGCDTGFGHRLALSLNERGFRVRVPRPSYPSPVPAHSS